VRDPRLAEIDFLSRLEREPMTFGISHDAAEGLFGLTANAAREMLIEMISEQLVNGPATALDPAVKTYDSVIVHAAEVARKDSFFLRKGTPVTYRITHKGRVHLWRRRDELRADRGREQFGILFDRRAWDRELSVQILFASASEPLALLFLDLDKFKAVNDTMGHPEGDRVLRRYMELVRDITGDRGDAYRIGGDELAVLLPKTGLDVATDLAEKIRAAVAAEFQAERVAATTSVGVASFEAPVSPDAAAKFVDARLYDAKHGGKNCVRAAAFAELGSS